MILFDYYHYDCKNIKQLKLSYELHIDYSANKVTTKEDSVRRYAKP